MNFYQQVVLSSVSILVILLFALHFYQSDKIDKNSSAIAEIRSTDVQQPQTGNLFSDSMECITGFSYYDSDTSIFFNDGYHRLVITHDYRKQTSSMR